MISDSKVRGRDAMGWGEVGGCLRLPSRIMNVTVVGTQADILLVETETTEHFIGPRDWVDGVASRLTWRARLRIRFHEWLVRLDAMVLGW